MDQKNTAQSSFFPYLKYVFDIRQKNHVHDNNEQENNCQN